VLCIVTLTKTATISLTDSGLCYMWDTHCSLKSQRVLPVMLNWNLPPSTFGFFCCRMTLI